MTEPKTPPQSTPPLPELYRTLLAQIEQPRKVSANYSIYKIPSGPHTPSSILESLEIEETILSNTAKEALEALEVASAAPDSDWLDFKWKLMAFTYVQDIFDSPLYAGDDIRTIFHQYYFYYESLNILTESVLCGLNGFYTAAYALLRLFLEFSLLQNYYYRITNETPSYHALERYFHTGIHPAWHTVLKKAFPNDEFSGTVRFRIHSHLRGLSESSIHPYHPDHSPAQHKDPTSPHSFEGLHFWVVTKLAVESALWSYHVNFPLLFHPVSLLKNSVMRSQSVCSLTKRAEPAFGKVFAMSRITNPSGTIPLLNKILPRC